MEKSIAICRDRKKAIEAEKLTGDNVYKVLMYFDKLYAVMEEADKRDLLPALIDEIQVYEEEQANGEWLKSIGFKLPIIDSEMDVKMRCIEKSTTQSKIAENIGTSLSYVNKIVRSKEQIMNKTFLPMMENLSFDVELHYVKREE